MLGLLFIKRFCRLVSKRLGLLLLASLFLFVSACGPDSSLKPYVECQSSKGVQPLCGFRNPEDIVVLPDQKTLLVAEMGGLDHHSTGNFSTVDSVEFERRPLNWSVAQDTPRWGDPTCSPPTDAISPHGLDLTQRQDGRWQLSVVNHVPRESIELFEVLMEDGGEVLLLWRGCVVAPLNAWLNSVAATTDGELLVTEMLPLENSTVKFMLAMIFKRPTGLVWHWTPATSWQEVAASDGQLPNGITLAKYPNIAYINMYQGKKVIKLDWQKGEVLGEFQCHQCDNITWGEGALWAASHDFSFTEMEVCDTTGACPLPFKIYRFDPQTMERRLVFASEGIPFGAGTVAIPLNGYLYMGSFTGDRIARVALKRP